MSNGDRGERASFIEATLIFLALIGTAFGLYYIGESSGIHTGRNQSYAATQQEKARESVNINCADSESVNFAQCAIENIEAIYEEGAAQQDLYAQQDMAKWALAMVLVSGMMAGLTLWALIYIRGTLSETRRMAGEATDATKAMVRQNKLAEAAHRAWVVIEPKITSLKITDRGVVRVESDTDFINRGRSIARDVSYMANVMPQHMINIDAVAERMFALFEEKEDLGISNLAPDKCETIDIKMTGGVGQPADTEAVAHYILISAWVRYRIQGSDETHATLRFFVAGKPWDILGKRPKLGIMPITDKDAGKLTAEQLHIVPFGPSVTT